MICNSTSMMKQGAVKLQKPSNSIDTKTTSHNEKQSCSVCRQQQQWNWATWIPCHHVASVSVPLYGEINKTAPFTQCLIVSHSQHVGILLSVWKDACIYTDGKSVVVVFNFHISLYSDWWGHWANPGVQDYEDRISSSAWIWRAAAHHLNSCHQERHGKKI